MAAAQERKRNPRARLGLLGGILVEGKRRGAGSSWRWGEELCSLLSACYRTMTSRGGRGERAVRWAGVLLGRGS